MVDRSQKIYVICGWCKKLMSCKWFDGELIERTCDQCLGEDCDLSLPHKGIHHSLCPECDAKLDDEGKEIP